MQNERPTEGEKKINEYVERIQSGKESMESVTQGLPPSFVSGIEAGLAQKRLKESEAMDQIKIEEIRSKLGIESEEKNHLVSELIKSVCVNRKQAVLDLYEKFLTEIDNPESRKHLIQGLFKDVYNRYRLADYPNDPEENHIWETYLKSTNIGINNKKKEWMYRGIFSGNSEETSTRGSFNVHVTPELIDKLDNIILSGKVKANYKFGMPGTPASPTERHDSISIYFLEQPSEEVLKELSEIVKPYVRGDNLLGKKIGDGFFMSEIGNVESKHIDEFVEQLKTKDAVFAEALRIYTTPTVGSSLKMSEAQFYSIKDVAKAFGYDISYNKDIGFEIT